MGYQDIDEAHEDVIRHGGSTNIIWHRADVGGAGYVPTRHVTDMQMCTGFTAECADGTHVEYEGTERRSIGSLSSPMGAQRQIEATGREVRGLPEVRR